MKTAHVEITFDVGCTWSYLAYTRFQRAAARFRDEGGVLDVAFRPFQLDPGASPHGEPKREVHRRHFGADFDHEGAMDEMSALGADLGLVFGHDAVWADSFEAHRLVAVASAQGHGEAMVERLFRAHHSEGLNIGDEAVLRRLAQETGVAWSAAGADGVRAELARVRADGIRGVPVFAFSGTRVPLVGDQSEAALDAALRSAASADASA
ncbi:DsbA family protein [Nocardiopsis aegyptia]|uniref:Putative DsbA family dithiol-disulfide isomerase n=1 Tax=Nocardiopsis aegyptia TaxID=220378 RepID=A0A7Z0EMW2_9ACTN|nr:DsbA family protein [Nocardiopsis aegyptia]NYJ34809.1 putative DsbA family dithiol-disulfide isomerase [Nocardiopsis aegyptia]